MKIALTSFLTLAFSYPLIGAEGINVDQTKKSVSIDAKIAPRKLDHLKGEIYPIEVIACWAYPKGQKAHETVVTFDVKPSEVHAALESLGLKPGVPVKGGEKAGTGPELAISLEFKAEDALKKLSVDKFLIDPRTKKPFPKSVKFRFTGSVQSQPDPGKPLKVYGADATGTLIAIYPVTDETVIQSSLTMKEEKYLKLEVNSEVLPKVGTSVKLILEASGK
jgi:hypothetical protein